MVKRAMKLIMMVFVAILSLQLVNAVATGQVINVSVTETIYEVVEYDPLQTGTGSFFDTGENQSIYNATGTIDVINSHQTDTVRDIVINITNNDANTFAYSTGPQGYVTTGNGFVVLVVPDLASGSTTRFTYNLNTTAVAPPLNFTSNYSLSRVFSGLNVDVMDRVSNTMNAAQYSSTCIRDIVINQSSLTVNQTATSQLLNFTFDNDTALTGGDAGNAAYADNRSINWNVLGGGCLNADSHTNVSYTLETPDQIVSAQVYDAVNTTINYTLTAALSRLSIESVDAISDLDPNFQKRLIELFEADNATWNVTGNLSSPSNISVNLTEVSFFVSVRNGTGTGFTDPSLVDNDTISGATLSQTYLPNVTLNKSLSWNNTNSPWLFNYTFLVASPIVWMDAEANIIDDGVQIVNSSVTYGVENIHVKQIYLATGYWLEISKNITRLAEGNYSINITVWNRGTSGTPANQVVIVYNFIPIAFNLSSAFLEVPSPWHNTTTTNATLTDATYNGTMFQHALVPDGNTLNSSLDRYGGAYNENNTWSIIFNVSGTGEFNFEDLFLTGVDPLSVEEVGGTKALSIENVYSVLSGKVEYLLMGLAAIVGVLLFAF